MTITGLLVALILIAIVCVIASAFLKLVPMQAPVPVIVWAVCAIICLLILLAAVQGHSFVGDVRLN